MNVTKVLSVDEDSVTFLLSDGSEETIGWHVDEYGDAVIDSEALAGLDVGGGDDYADDSRALLDEAIGEYLAENEEEEDEVEEEDE